MGLPDRLSLLLCLAVPLSLGIASAFAVEPSPTPIKNLMIERKEDELLLPPYLRDYDSGILNVVSERMSDEGHTRSAKPGEWLEYGDSFSTPDRMAFYVLMNEGLQWVGGGVFNGKITGGMWNSSKPAYEMVMNRGWVKVWARPSPFTGSLQIKTPRITLVASDAVFWVQTSALKTEVYVLSGSVQAGDQTCESEKFCEWVGKAGKKPKTSEKWDFVSLENRISGLYPQLVKLSHRANDEWLDDTSAKKYGELRKKGWKKADRYYPTPTPKK